MEETNDITQESELVHFLIAIWDGCSRHLNHALGLWTQICCPLRHLIVDMPGRGPQPLIKQLEME